MGIKSKLRQFYPATGYIAMAFEAAAKIADGKSIHLMPVKDLTINQAIAFSEDSKGVEILFRVYQMSTEGDFTRATFSCHADIGGNLKSCASSHLLM
ncbi:hypothetical protein BDV19DRAFT_354272, partial [Aspergillus venezuelensis]